MLLVQSFLKYNKVQSVLRIINNDILLNFLVQTTFLHSYYRLNDQMWQDGFLIDFLQKKFLDKWIRRFLIVSAYLFNERVIFDRLVRAYTDLVIWTGNKNTIFEFDNVASTLLVTHLMILTIFLTLTLNYWFLLFIA